MRTLQLSFLCLAVISFAGFAACSGASAQTLRYTIVSNGHTAGTEVDVYSADGSVESNYEFNDRGRGPKISAKYVFSPDGVPTRAQVTGVDYLKAPVDERFSVENGTARWKSSAENGSGPAGAFYLTTNGAFAPEMANLIKAMSTSKDQSFKLFP